MCEAVILCNGDYPTAPLPLQVLEESPYVVCCDGAAGEYLRRGRVPDAIVGDMDSLDKENRQRYRHLVHPVSEQDDNDQTKAVRFLLAQGKRRIAIVGATGKREDHTIGNVSLLIEYMRLGADVRTYTDTGIFIPCRGRRTFPCRIGQQVSIFNFTARTMLGDGLLYPLRAFTNWWQGTLNESAGTEFTIKADGEYLVYLNME